VNALVILRRYSRRHPELSSRTLYCGKSNNRYTTQTGPTSKYSTAIVDKNIVTLQGPGSNLVARCRGGSWELC
jgi:hypothetical protein